MLKIGRTVLYLAVALWALVVILSPEARQVGRSLFVLLYFVLAGDVFIREWRSGYLHKTFAEIARNPPRTDPLEFLAIALGTIALTMTMSSL
jgi:hypothetical protein